jgi:hypothetical protein
MILYSKTFFISTIIGSVFFTNIICEELKTFDLFGITLNVNARAYIFSFFFSMFYIAILSIPLILLLFFVKEFNKKINILTFNLILLSYFILALFILAIDSYDNHILILIYLTYVIFGSIETYLHLKKHKND